jgi:hypothetical protein
MKVKAALVSFSLIIANARFPVKLFAEAVFAF